MTNISTLLYVPILHTQREASEIITSSKGEGEDESKTLPPNEHIGSIDEMWEGIRQKIDETRVPYHSIRIYQEALPVCGFEVEIVKKLAEKNSKNHLLILELMVMGAKLEGTEDPDLLLKEYDYLKELFGNTSRPKQTGDKDVLDQYNQKSIELMQKRDQFIAERIKKTIKAGEIPLVFMGVRHQLEKLLQQHFVITYIIYRLPFKKVGDIYNV